MPKINPKRQNIAICPNCNWNFVTCRSSDLFCPVCHAGPVSVYKLMLIVKDPAVFAEKPEI